MLRFKPGVKLGELEPQIVLAAIAISGAYHESGASDCTITSGNDGVHLPESKHYIGEALDFRTHGLREQGVDPTLLVEKIRTALGDNYDVLLEYLNAPSEHIHAEYDPK